MKIYATGMNPADCNALKRAPRVAIFQAFGAMMEVLKDCGEDINWRVTKVGDDIPHDTDAIIVSSMLPRSLNCPYALGVMWAMSVALTREIPLVIYLTDWAFFRAKNEFKSIAKAGVPYFSKQIGGALQYREDPAMIERYGEHLVEVCRQYAHGGQLWDQAQILVPKYTNWGEMKIIQNYLPGANSVFPMDPSPSFVRYLLGENAGLPLQNNDGQRRWLLPSLLNDSTWLDRQNLKWPVDRFGPKGFDTVESERSVQMLYRQRAGALCPPYPTEGSGWWRSRWIHSAIAGSVLYAGYGDQVEMGGAYQVTGSRLEEMIVPVLWDTAESQRDQMWNLLQLDTERMAHQIYDPFMAAGA